MNRAIVVGLLLGSLVGGSTVEAQGWLEDRERREGPGFRVGNLELHPGIGAEVGYDSNVFLSEDNEQDSIIFRISPHLDISTLSGERREEEGNETPPKVEFRAGVSGSLYLYLDTEARNNLAANADMALTVLPNRPFSFTLSNHYSRSIRPFTEQSAESNTARSRNASGLDLNFRTRGGVFNLKLGYGFAVDLFEGNAFDFANRYIHTATLSEHWLFLPRTSLFHETSLDYTTYPNDGPNLALSNNARFRTRLGLNGVISNKVSALVAVGYGSAFVDDPSLREFDTVIAQAELRVRPTPTTKLSFGYERDFVGSVLGNYQTRDRGYLDFQLLMGRSFLIGLNGWVGYLDFGTIVDRSGMPISADGDTERSDIFVNLGLFAEYRFTDWLGLNASFGYTGDFTDFDYSRVIGSAPVVDPADFNRFEAWLGLRVFY